MITQTASATIEQVEAMERMPSQHVPTRPVAALPQAATTPAQLLTYALQSGADLDRLEKLMELQMKWEANEARKAYVADMAEFKRNPPVILKDKRVGYENRDGTFTGYTHATLGNVTNAIVEGLAQHGFSHSWDVKQNGGSVEVACRITHRLGHAETVTMTAGKDDSGKKNMIQQVASAITYLERYTLLAATGLATHDQSDDDGQGGGSDEALAGKWVAKANAAKALADLDNVWRDGLAEINAAQDQAAYDDLLAACKARKAELTAGAGNAKAEQGTRRSSRMSGIVNRAKAETVTPKQQASTQAAAAGLPADQAPPWDGNLPLEAAE